MAESILVVDDEQEIADLVEVYLQNEGYTVHKFYNAKDALNCLDNTTIWMAFRFADRSDRSFISRLSC